MIRVSYAACVFHEDLQSIGLEPNTSDCFKLSTARIQDVLLFLQRIVAFLVTKKKKAHEAMVWIQTRRTLKEYLHSSENAQKLTDMRNNRWPPKDSTPEVRGSSEIEPSRE